MSTLISKFNFVNVLFVNYIIRQKINIHTYIHAYIARRSYFAKSYFGMKPFYPTIPFY